MSTPRILRFWFHSLYNQRTLRSEEPNWVPPEEGHGSVPKGRHKETGLVEKKIPVIIVT